MKAWLLWFLFIVGVIAFQAIFGKKDPQITVDTTRVKDERGVKVATEEAYQDEFQKWTATWSGSIDRTRWIPAGTLPKIIESYPPPVWIGVRRRISTPELDTKSEFASHNQQVANTKRLSRKAFFDTVEKNPLTSEQIDACICMDESVLIVAAAGSGKTSTMVAKTGYILVERLASPEEILLLAFNRDAAAELSERIADRLHDVENIDKVRSQTFNAFGLYVIGIATGAKPSVAPWVEQAGQDIPAILDIVAQVSEADANFKSEWETFRTIYGRDMGPWDDTGAPEAYGDGKRGFRTAKGDIVKSKQERLIADWLFFHGVDYVYERPYEFETATSHHRQYAPDFYYPAINLYHEHFALNSTGKAPASFDPGYVDGVKWKRALHNEKGTLLFETTSHGLAYGSDLQRLRAELSGRGVVLAFDATREGSGQKPVTDRDVASTIRIFQQHVKNNGLSRDQLYAAAKARSNEGNNVRDMKFLSIYERIETEWERRLKAGNYIDFEDMLLQAAEHVETGRYQSPYKVVLADEFQDSSRARIRLLKALVNAAKGKAHLCVVGDDWQGINRFAGADIAVMTEFEKTFEHATRRTLGTTFRSPQAICDASSTFVQANKAQIRKSVFTTNPITNNAILAYGFQHAESIPQAVAEQLGKLHQLFQDGRVARRVSVMLLGRYRSDMPQGLRGWQNRFEQTLDIKFQTVHASKGTEAEYVFLLNVLEGSRGFPSQIGDDPVLQLAMPAPDPFPMAEERRLFYVALTRASKQVRIFTTLATPSRFLLELVKQGHLTIKPIDGELLESCPKCRQGVVFLRSGKFGQFHSCSTFPRCDFKRGQNGRVSM